MLKYLPAILLALVSLLAIFRAPTNFLWRVAVVVTELSWFPLALTLILAAVTWYYNPKNYGLLGTYTLVFLLFTLPVYRAYSESSQLEKELNLVFGTKTPSGQRNKPYSFWRSLTPAKDKVYFKVFPYQEVDGKTYTYHFYEAKTTAPAPLVIVIYGGSWVDGDANQIPEINSYLAKRGVHVAAINYRMAPKYKYPAQVDDVETLLHAVRHKFKSTHVEFSKVILLGRSAGGQIALQAGYGKLKNEVDGVISFYAPADMLWGAKQITNDWVLDVDKVLRDYIGCSVKENEAPYVAASAPPLVDKDTPPTLLIHGKIDAMVSHEHSTRLMKTLNKNNVRSYLIEMSSVTHGCDYIFNGPSGQISTFAIERFIANL